MLQEGIRDVIPTPGLITGDTRMVVVARTSHAEKVRVTALMIMNAFLDMYAGNKTVQKEKALVPGLTVVSWLVVHINSVSLLL